MAYATVDDFVTYYGLEDARVSADRDNDLTLDIPALTMNLESNASVMDAFLSQNDAIVLPLNEWPDSLRQCNIELTAWSISQNIGASSEMKKARAEYWLKYMLPMIASGKVGIGEKEEPEETPSSARWAGEKRVFTQRSMRGLL